MWGVPLLMIVLLVLKGKHVTAPLLLPAALLPSILLLELQTVCRVLQGTLVTGRKPPSPAPSTNMPLLEQPAQHVLLGSILQLEEKLAILVQQVMSVLLGNPSSVHSELIVLEG